MYVCICRAVTENKIRRAVADGARTLGDLSRELELGTCCGKCVPAAREVLRACAPRTTPPMAATADTQRSARA